MCVKCGPEDSYRYPVSILLWGSGEDEMWVGGCKKGFRIASVSTDDNNGLSDLRISCIMFLCC